jgi:hypothetical protein
LKHHRDFKKPGRSSRIYDKKFEKILEGLLGFFISYLEIAGRPSRNVFIQILEDLPGFVIAC